MAKRPEETEAPKKEEQGQSKSMPSYLSAALRVSASLPLGSKTVDEDIFNGVGTDKPIPGVMVLDYVPTLGVSKDATSAVNRAAFYEFNFIRSQISGNRPYEPADHMIYRMAIDSLRDMYLYVCRIYACVSTYCATNLYKPKFMLEAMGLTATDWINNAADLYQWLRVHAGSLQPFPTVPMGNITTRRNVFNSVFFTDGDLGRSQTYIINQKYFWSYEVVDEVKGLTPRAFPKTFSEFRSLWDEMYTALQNSSDVYIIAADIRRAFGDRIITDLVAPDVDAKVEYMKFDSILETIMNASILPTSDYYHEAGPTVGVNNYRIEDVEGIIKCDPSYHMTVDALYDSYYPGSLRHINTVAADPTPETILNCVRGKACIAVSVYQHDMMVTVKSIGTEVFTGATIGILEYNNTRNLVELRTMPISTFMAWDLSEQTSGTKLRTYSLLSNFDWHPPVVIAEFPDPNSMDLTNPYRIEDIQNYIPLSDKQLRDIHEAVLLGEFGLPE